MSWYQKLIIVVGSSALENITSRIEMYPYCSLGRCGNIIDLGYLRPFRYFFLRNAHFPISTAQKTILDASRVNINSYKDSGWVLKTTLKKGT